MHVLQYYGGNKTKACEFHVKGMEALLQSRRRTTHVEIEG